MLFQTFVIDSPFLRRLEEQRRKRRDLQQYLAIEEEIERTAWPPVSQTSQSIAHLLRMESLPAAGGDLDPNDIDNNLSRIRFDSGGSYENPGYEEEGGVVPSSPSPCGGQQPDIEAPLLDNEERMAGQGDNGQTPQFTVL